jgi:hypothetical protein
MSEKKHIQKPGKVSLSSLKFDDAVKGMLKAKPKDKVDGSVAGDSRISMRDQYLPENDAPEEERSAWRKLYRAVAERRYGRGN